MTPEELVQKLPPFSNLPETAQKILLVSIYDNTNRHNCVLAYTEVVGALGKLYQGEQGKDIVPLREFLTNETITVLADDAILRMPVPYTRPPATPLPFILPEPERFEHTWILGPQGTGKSQLIQYLLMEDFKKVAVNEASVLVMDSQGTNEMLGRIEHLKLFDDELKGKLITISTASALNIFDMGRTRLSLSARDREMFHNNALDLITYVFSATLGDGGNFTPKQATLFRYCIQLLLNTPESNVADLLRLMLPKGLDHYRQWIPTLDPPAWLFFSTQFDDPKQYMDTKREIVWRLDSLMQRTSFARMFTSKKSLDLFSELNSSKVILVDTDKALLGKEGTEIFGRFIIALLLSASQQRATLARTKRIPVYCYIDECSDYIAKDENISTIIDQARKMNIGLVLANQRIAQISSPNVLDALYNTTIKFIAHADKSLATRLGLDPALFNQPERHFLYHVRRGGSRSLEVPFFVMENAPKRIVPRETPSERPLEGEVLPPVRELLPSPSIDDIDTSAR